MKEVNKLVLLLGLSAFLPFAASAKSFESAYLENYPKSSDVPVPVAVVSPSVAPKYAGSTVELEFTVDASGKPTGLNVISSPDSTLAVAVVEAVKQWKFTPAKLDGSPVAKKVVLPVKIVDAELVGTRYAMN
jgi:TonB family protein